MSSLFKVTEIDGKGLGCVAISDIKKGSLILMETPQLCVESSNAFESPEGSSMWIRHLLKSFYGMSKADQLEYMTLHNSFNNFKKSEDIQNCKEIRDRQIKAVKIEIGKIEQDPEKAEEIFKIYGIWSTNSFQGSENSLSENEYKVYFKVSRINHSCQPNAMVENVNGQFQLRAIEKIKAGKEINITYLDDFSGFRNRKYRQQSLLNQHFYFLCSCELCENDVDIDSEAFEASIQEAETLNIKLKSALKAGISLGAQYYSLENCRK